MPASPDDVTGPPPGRPSTATGAFLEGWRRAFAAPGLVLALWVLTIASAAALTGATGLRIDDPLNPDATAGRFDERAATPAGLLTREVLGFGAALAVVPGALPGNEPVRPVVVVAMTVHALVWLAVLGAILDRLARARRVRPVEWLGACRRYALRFLRLSLLVWPIHLLMTLWLPPVALLPAFALVGVIVDLARVRMVVEDRHSAVAAVAAAGRFVRRRLGKTAWLYALNVMAWLAVLALWRLAVPAEAPVAAGLGASAVYLAVRIWVRLGLLGSEVAFFQAELAHRARTPLAEPVWPDSPAVERTADLH